MTALRNLSLGHLIKYLSWIVFIPLIWIYGCTGTYTSAVLKINSSSPDIRRIGVDELAQRKEPASLPVLLMLLDDEDENVVQSSILALVNLRSPSAIRPMASKLNHPDAAIRYSLKKGLETFGDEAVLPLAQMLRHNNPDIREAAAEILGRIGNPGAAIPLVGVLLDSNPDKVRMAAVVALGEIRDIRTAGVLVDAVKEKTSMVPYLIPDALSKFGSQAIPFLTPLLNDPDEDIVRLAILSLGKTGDSKAVPSLLGKIKEKDSLTRQVTVDALIGIGVAVIPELIEEAKSESPEIRKEWLQVITGIGAPAVMPMIEELIQGDEKFYTFASKALSSIGSEAVRPLIEAIANENPEVSMRAQETLTAINGPAVLPLIETLKKPYGATAPAVASVLGRIGDERAIPVLLEGMKDGDEALQKASQDGIVETGKPAVLPLFEIAVEEPLSGKVLASEALIRIGAPAAEELVRFLGDRDDRKKMKSRLLLTQMELAAVPALITSLADPDLEVGENASDILADIGPLSVIPLIEVLQGEDPDRSWRAVRILGKIGDLRGAPALMVSSSGRDPVIRYLAVEALSRLKDPESIPVLVRALRDWTVRKRAAEALDSLHWHPRDFDEKIRYQIAVGTSVPELKNDEILKLLLSEVRGGDGRRIFYGVQALMDIRGDEVTEDLIRLLQSEGSWEMAKAYIESKSEKLVTKALDWIRGKPDQPEWVDRVIISREAVI